MDRCDTTMTERLPRDQCTCGDEIDGMGPCETWEPGAIIDKGDCLCVYCAHTKACHAAQVYNVTSSLINDGWNVTRRDGRLRLHFKTKDEAISWVVMKARCIVYIHKRDGTVDFKMTIEEAE